MPDASPTLTVERVDVPEVETIEGADSQLGDATSMAPEEWLSAFKARLNPEELGQYEAMRGKWGSADEMQESFGADLDAAKAAIDRELGLKASATAVKQRSTVRQSEIREFVKSRGILDTAGAAEIIDELPANPSKSEIAEAARKLRTIVVSDLVAEQDAAMFPGAQIRRDVQVYAEQPLPVDEFRAMPKADKHGLTLRQGRDGLEHVYKKETDIDGLITEKAPPGGRAKILRMEQQKAGMTDSPASASAQNAKALEVIERPSLGNRRSGLSLKTGSTSATRLI